MKNYDVSNMGVKDVIITPSTSNIIKPPSIYDGKITVQGDANLIAANILSGKSIFGVAGNITAKQKASGTGTTNNLGWASVSGLSFTPTLFILFTVSSTWLNGNTSTMGSLAVYCAEVSTSNFQAISYYSGSLQAGNWPSSNFTISSGAFSVGFTQNANDQNKIFYWYAYV